MIEGFAVSWAQNLIGWFILGYSDVEHDLCVYDYVQY